MVEAKITKGKPKETKSSEDQIVEQSATQKYPMGAIRERCGRMWLYCKAGEDIPVFHIGTLNHDR